MPGSAPYRAAIVGCGRKAATLDDEDRCRINYSVLPDSHAAAYRQVAGVRLVAAADPNEPRRRLMQDRWGVSAVYADYREMLTRERPDVVSVTTRAPLHAEVTVAAAEAGARGILCEKAIAVSLREADAMIAACQRAGAVLMVNHTRRWHPTYEAARQAVAAGLIGDLRGLIGICPGPLVHNGTHLFDLMRLFGGPVAWLTGHVRPGPAADRPGHAMLHFESGAVGCVDLDSALGLALELQGTRGRLFVDPSEEGFTLWEYREAPTTALRGRAWYQGRSCPARTVRHVVPPAGRGTLVAALEELVACVERRGANRSSGVDGRAALELALAVYHSDARGGARVAVPLEALDLGVPSR